MKAAKREVFLALSRVPIPWPRSEEEMSEPAPACLCTFCKYAQWEGWCFEPEIECQHPLARISEFGVYTSMGDDCWGFRSQFLVDTIAEFVGQRLQGQFVELPG